MTFEYPVDGKGPSKRRMVQAVLAEEKMTRAATLSTEVRNLSESISFSKTTSAERITDLGFRS